MPSPLHPSPFHPLTDAFAPEFMQRALLGGVLVAAICAVVGTWVVIRGAAFLGEAMAHGMLPGVAIATLLQAAPLAGAAASVAVMAAGVAAITRRARLGADAAIGILFVGMLALGVVIVSARRDQAVDLTAVLFGDVLAIRPPQLALLAGALGLVLVLAVTLHRPLLALAFDERIAATLGLRPRAAEVALFALIGVAVVVSYEAVGSLLVVGLLVAPAAAALLWARRVPAVMLLAAGIGALGTVLGLLLSWHAGSAAGASIALAVVALFVASAVLRAIVARLRPLVAPRGVEAVVAR